MNFIKLIEFRRALCGFWHAKSANVAMIFGLSLLPLAIAAGAAIDYAQAMMVRSQMLDALDAAALAVGSQIHDNNVDPNTLAQKVFDANYKGPGHPTVTPSIADQSVKVTGTDNVATTVLALAGKTSLSVSATSIVEWGQTKLWVSLVLDNTGSMTQTDNSGLSKIDALKDASHQLLAQLQTAAASANPGDVQVAIIPFAKDVNVGRDKVNAGWIDWSDWNLQMPGSAPASTVGPGSNCPLSLGCITQPGSTTRTNSIPSSGSYSGYICPDAVGSSNTGQTGHYYDGCYDSEGTTSTTTQTISSGRNATCNGYSNCSCSGSGRRKVCKAPVTTVGAPYVHKWIINNHSVWNGCVMDRDQDDDVNDTTPGNKFPAENDDSCVIASVMPLSHDWDALDTRIESMIANGGTNQTIGLAHGMQIQMTGNPYNASTLPANTTRYIILLSDGLNTMDRWYGNGSSQSSSVDDRMELACKNAKDQGFIVYTLFVDLNGTQGNSAALQNCASDTSKYYDLKTSSAIVTAFNDIAQKITNLRVTH